MDDIQPHFLEDTPTPPSLPTMPTSFRDKYIVEEGDIRSRNYVAGQQGWRLTPTSVELETVTPLLAISKTALGTYTPWTPWAPTYGGFSVNPIPQSSRYIQIGKLVIFKFDGASGTNGTSNATNFTISAPIQASTNSSYTPCAWINAGSAGPTHGCAFIAAGSSTIQIGSTPLGGFTTWTNTGDKNCEFTLIYEVA